MSAIPNTNMNLFENGLFKNQLHGMAALLGDKLEADDASDRVTISTRGSTSDLATLTNMSNKSSTNDLLSLDKKDEASDSEDDQPLGAFFDCPMIDFSREPKEADAIPESENKMVKISLF